MLDINSPPTKKELKSKRRNLEMSEAKETFLWVLLVGLATYLTMEYGWDNNRAWTLRLFALIAVVSSMFASCNRPSGGDYERDLEKNECEHLQGLCQDYPPVKNYVRRVTTQGRTLCKQEYLFLTEEKERLDKEQACAELYSI